jgi:hypothetical protein
MNEKSAIAASHPPNKRRADGCDPCVGFPTHQALTSLDSPSDCLVSWPDGGRKLTRPFPQIEARYLFGSREGFWLSRLAIHCLLI